MGRKCPAHVPGNQPETPFSKREEHEDDQERLALGRRGGVRPVNGRAGAAGDGSRHDHKDSVGHRPRPPSQRIAALVCRSRGRERCRSDHRGSGRRAAWRRTGLHRRHDAGQHPDGPGVHGAGQRIHSRVRPVQPAIPDPRYGALQERGHRAGRRQVQRAGRRAWPEDPGLVRQRLPQRVQQGAPRRHARGTWTA